MLNKKTEEKIKEAFSIFNNADSVVIEYQNVFPKIVISVGIKNIGYGYYDGGVAIEIGCS